MPFCCALGPRPVNRSGRWVVIGAGSRWCGVIRSQADPRHQSLAHEHLTPAQPTDVAPVLLLHGLGATSATWCQSADCSQRPDTA